MNDDRVYQIVPHRDGNWAVKQGQSILAMIAFDSKDVAVAFAQNLARINRPSKVVIYKCDQTVERETQYDGSEHFSTSPCH